MPKYLRGLSVRVAASMFKFCSGILRGTGASSIPIIKPTVSRLAGFLHRNIPDFTIIDGNRIYLDRKDRLNLFFRKHEPQETAIFKKMISDGDAVLDVGAHIGYYTIVAARLVGRNGKVVSFEPDPANFEILKKNVERNNYKNVIVSNNAASDRSGGTMPMYYYPSPTGDGNYLASVIREEDGLGEIVKNTKTISIDAFLVAHNIDKVNFMKIDVDGAEHLVIRGLLSTLQRNEQLAMILEYNFDVMQRIGVNPEDDISLLKNNGFTIYVIDEFNNDLKELQQGHYNAGRNLFCLKGEKVIQLARGRKLLRG